MFTKFTMYAKRPGKRYLAARSELGELGCLLSGCGQKQSIHHGLTIERQKKERGILEKGKISFEATMIFKSSHDRYC